MDNYFTEQISMRVMELDFQLTEAKAALDQIEKARTGIDWYSGGVYGICTQLFDALSNILKILGVVTLILIHAPLLFTVTAVLILVSSFVSKRQNVIEIEAFRRLSKSNRIFGYLAWELMDFRYGKDIRLYAAQDMMVEKWNSYIDDSLKNWKWQADQALPLDHINAVCSAINDFFTYLYLGFLVITGNITIGIFSHMLSASSTLQSATQGLIRNVKDLIKRTSYAYEYVKFMDYPAAIEKGTLHVTDKPHTIEFRNVSFSYPNTDVQVLSSLNIMLHPGKHLSVVAEYDICRQFNALVGGKTAIYISHRLSSCKFCDRIAVFSDGRIKEYGTHDELVKVKDGIYAEMFAAQAQYYN